MSHRTARAQTHHQAQHPRHWSSQLIIISRNEPRSKAVIRDRVNSHSHSKGNVIVEAVEAPSRRLCRLLLRLPISSLRRLTLLRCRLGIFVIACTIAATAVEHLHFVGDDLSGVAILSVLALPFARAQRALYVHFGTLFQVFTGNFGQTVKEHHAVPLCTLLRLTGLLIFPAFRCRHTHVGDRTPLGHKTGFRVLPQIADKNDFFNSPCHSNFLSLASRSRRSWQIYNHGPFRADTASLLDA